MLHDLFMISEYFEPPFAYTTERQLVDQYGPQTVFTALALGYLERKTVPYPGGTGEKLCFLSEKGLSKVLEQTA